MNRRRTRFVLAATAAAGLWSVGPGTAAAHIAPDPSSVEAGRTTVVAFTVQHGCDTSPTVEVAVAVPAGFGTLTGVAKAGWTVSNEPTVVTFRGGELPATEPGTFELSVTPTGGARTVHLPIVQRCRTGELRWIAVAGPGAPEPDYPAPMLTITGSSGSAGAATNAPTTATPGSTGATGTPGTAGAVTNAATDATGHGAGGHDDGVDDGTDHEQGGTTTAADERTGSAIAPGGRSSTPLLIGGAVVATGVLIGVGWGTRRGRRP